MKFESKPFLFKAKKRIDIMPKDFFSLLTKKRAIELIYEEFRANPNRKSKYYKKNAESMYDDYMGKKNADEPKTFKETVEGYSQYFSCPYCGKFHCTADYFLPNTSWEDLIEKYKEDIFMFFITSLNYFRRGYVTTVKETLFFLIQPYDDYERNIMNGCNLEENIRRFVPSNEFLINEDGSLKCVCPSCGANIKTNNVFNTFYDYSNLFSQEEYAEKRLSREPSWFWDNVIPYNYEIFTRDDEDTVCLSIINWRVFPNVHGKTHIETTNERYVFNVKTGMAYAFREIRLDNKKPLLKDEQRITNITYKTGINSYRFFIPLEAAEETIKVILKKKGLDENSISLKNLILGSKSVTASVINIANRYGKYGQDFFDLFEKISHFDSYDRCTISTYYKKKMKDMQENTELFFNELKRRKISSKMSRKLIAKNPMLFFLEKRIKELGFKDINVVNYLLENAQVLSAEKIFWTSKNIDYFNNERYSVFFTKFLEDYCKTKSEKELAKKIIENIVKKKFVLKDTIRMYHEVCLKAEMNDDFREYLFKGKLEEIHDKLSVTADLIKGRDFFINYEKEEIEKYCMETDNYYFELAKKSSDMKKVGGTMHICVGSYDNRAFHKNCIIVFMKDKKTHEPAVCIEISPDGKRLIQAKDYCNKKVTPEKLPELKAYVRALKLNDDCYDIGNSFKGIVPSEIKKSTDIEGYNICEKEKMSEKVYVESDLIKKGLSLKQNEPNYYNNNDDFDFF